VRGMTIGARVRAALAAAAAVAAVAAAAAFAPPATATAPAAGPPAPSWAPAGSAAIRPGVLTETAGGGVCTANFVFTSGARTFLGQAAHCAGTGADTETDGCTSGTRPLGTAVRVRATDGTARTATLAYSSWVTMRARGEADRDTCAFNDLALVELAPADTVDVNPSVPFFGGPTGVDIDGTRPGEEVFTYGSSPGRLGVLRPKVGVSARGVGGGWGHEVYTVAPGVAGDSGSAVLDSGGAAVGLLSTLNLDPLPVSGGVTDLARALAYARTYGGLGPVELVRGTEPFDPAPAGVPATDLAPPAGPPAFG
jgi:hypothetical protein